MTINQAYLLKGWLLDKNPPAEVAEAIESIIASLSRSPDVITSDCRVTNFIVDHDEQESPRDPPVKKRREWSPEARAAAGKRMKDRIAAGKMTRRNPAPGEAEAPSQSGA